MNKEFVDVSVYTGRGRSELKDFFLKIEVERRRDRGQRPARIGLKIE